MTQTTIDELFLAQFCILIAVEHAHDVHGYVIGTRQVRVARYTDYGKGQIDIAVLVECSAWRCAHE